MGIIGVLNKIPVFIKRIRASLGVTFGLILMYLFLKGAVNSSTILFAIGFLFIHLFGDLYNDYEEFEKDQRNKRPDKLFVIGINKKSLKSISYFCLFIGLILLWFLGISSFLVGCYLALIVWTYSYPKFSFKKYSLFTYIASAAVFLLIPIPVNHLAGASYNQLDLIISLFCLFQVIYLLCQKDSTDINEGEINLFTTFGLKISFLISSFFAFAAAFMLFIISFQNPIFFVFWIFNIIIKMLNIAHIWRNKISRSGRSKLVALELILPYLYILEVLFNK